MLLLQMGSGRHHGAAVLLGADLLVAAVIAYQKISAKKHGGPVMTA